jgi:hypothetical protein
MLLHRLRPARRSALLIAELALALLATTLLTCTAVGAQTAAAKSNGPDLQGLWDFTMHVGERRSTGFIALGPVEHGWAGSITPDSTNTLAIRLLTVHTVHTDPARGDSVHMVVASREGDVPFFARLSRDGTRMEGIVHYHGGAHLPMTATRRLRPAPRP